jgi:hypothetical protein
MQTDGHHSPHPKKFASERSSHRRARERAAYRRPRRPALAAQADAEGARAIFPRRRRPHPQEAKVEGWTGRRTRSASRSSMPALLGLSRATLYRQTQFANAPSAHVRERSPPRLSDHERQVVLDTLHSDEFVDQPPSEVSAEALAMSLPTERGMNLLASCLVGMVLNEATGRLWSRWHLAPAICRVWSCRSGGPSPARVKPSRIDGVAPALNPGGTTSRPKAKLSIDCRIARRADESALRLRRPVFVPLFRRRSWRGLLAMHLGER